MRGESINIFKNYWLQILIFSSTRGCSLEGGRGIEYTNIIEYR